jgi:ferrous-iron efflux pump FieF
MTMTNQSESVRLMRLATYASVITALVLISAKLVAWFMTGSISILATLIDSGLDMLASIINLIAVRYALQPADKEHRFGHGKAEAIAGMWQAVLVLSSALFLIFHSIDSITSEHTSAVDYGVGLGVMLFSILATSLLILFQNYVVTQTQSTAIKADALHYKTDLWVNLGVVLALFLSLIGLPAFDGIIALLISFFIIYSAWEIIVDAINLLMDRELPDTERNKVIAAVESHRDVLGLHDLRTRRSGNNVFIQLHLELDASLKLALAHHISEQVEQSILAIFPDAEVIIHQDPI